MSKKKKGLEGNYSLYFSWFSVTVCNCAFSLWQCKVIWVSIVVFHWLETAPFYSEIFINAWNPFLVLKLCPLSLRANVTWIALHLQWAASVHMDSYGAVIWCTSDHTVHSRLPLIQKAQGEILVTGERDWELHKIQKHDFTLIFSFSLLDSRILCAFNFSTVVNYALHWPYIILDVSSNRR